MIYSLSLLPGNKKKDRLRRIKKITCQKELKNIGPVDITGAV
jgi:hypothetical protein